MTQPRRFQFPALFLTAVVALAACQSEVDESAPADTSGGIQEISSLPNPATAVDRPWGMPPEGMEWGQVSSVALAHDGENIWAIDRCGSSSCIGSDRDVVFQLEPGGAITRSFGSGMFARPHGVFVDSDGNVWVTDHQNARPEQLEEYPAAVGVGQQVFKFSPTGEVLLALGTAGEPGDPPDRLNNPTDVIVAENGDIFISEGHSYQNPPGRISKFSSDGTFIESFGSFGSGPEQFSVPHGLAFDSRGQLYVADRGNNRIQVLDQSGNFLRELRQFGRPNDVFIDRDDTLYAPDSESDDERNPDFLRGIYVGNAVTGEVTGFIPGHEFERDAEGTIGEGVALDSRGNLYVAEVTLLGLTRYTVE